MTSFPFSTFAPSRALRERFNLDNVSRNSVYMNRYLIFTAITATFIFLLASFNDQEPSDKAELGELLFFDPILSKDRTISCASCHIPAFAFADTAVFSTGAGGKKGVRNSPSAMNLLLQRHFFWDGRA